MENAKNKIEKIINGKESADSVREAITTFLEMLSNFKHVVNLVDTTRKDYGMKLHFKIDLKIKICLGCDPPIFSFSIEDEKINEKHIFTVELCIVAEDYHFTGSVNSNDCCFSVFCMEAINLFCEAFSMKKMFSAARSGSIYFQGNMEDRQRIKRIAMFNPAVKSADDLAKNANKMLDTFFENNTSGAKSFIDLIGKKVRIILLERPGYLEGNEDYIFFGQVTSAKMTT